MAAPKYSNREIEEMHKDLREYLVRIEAQTVKTNGRVTALEMKQAKREGAALIVALVFGVFITILISYLAWVGVQIMNIPNTIHTALDQYNLEIDN